MEGNADFFVLGISCVQGVVSLLSKMRFIFSQQFFQKLLFFFVKGSSLFLSHLNRIGFKN